MKLQKHPIFSSVRNRLIAGLCLLSLLFGGYIARMEYIKRTEMAILINRDKAIQKKQIDKTLDLTISGIRSYTRDITYWDDMVKFVNNPSFDKNFAFANFEASMVNFNAQYAWTFNQKVQQSYYFSYKDLPPIPNFPLNEQEIRQMTAKKWFNHFFIQRDNQFIEIFFAPVHPVFDAERKTPPRGYYAIGRVWQKKHLETLAVLLSSQVSIHAEPVSETEDANPYDLTNLIPITDWQNKRIGTLVIQAENTTLSNLDAANQKQYPILAGFIIAILVSLIVTTERWVLRPLRLLGLSLQTERTDVLKTIEGQQTEFSMLASLIRSFFTQKQALESEISIRKQRENELRVIKDNLELMVTQRTAELETSNTQLAIQRDQAQKYLDIAGTIIAIINKQGQLVLINKKTTELLEYSEAELIGKHWSFLLADQSEIELRMANFVRLLNKEVALPVNAITGLRSKSGKALTFLINFSFLEEGADTAGAIILSAADITILKETETALIEARDKAQVANRAKNAFYANMSHELRTPMIGILGYSEMMIDLTDSPQLQKMARGINVSGKRLLNTLNMILDLSRAESQNETPEMTYTDIVATVEHSVLQFAAAAQKKDLYLRFNSSIQSLFAYSNEHLLGGIIHNLMDNAIKFTDLGGISVMLEHSAPNSFKIIFKDTGEGIAEESLSLIFEEFRQASEGFGRKFEGAGLGLSITQRYITMLGGKIEVTSTVGSGSQFTVVLPIYNQAPMQA